MKKAINNIMTQLVQINEYIDSDVVQAEYKHNKIMNGLIKSSKHLFHYEYDDNVIKDEAYASMLEALYIASQKLSLAAQDISLNNDKLMCLSYSIAEHKMKKHLYDSSKRKTAKHTYTTTVDDCDIMSHVLDERAIKAYDREDKTSELYRYINRNKSRILTKKQCKYLDDKLDCIDEKTSKQAKENDRQFRRRIEKRIEKSFNDLRPAVALIHDRNTIIDSIVNADDFRTEYSKYQDEDFIIEAILEVDSNTRRAFNKGSNNESVITKYKRALRRAKQLERAF